MATDGELKGYGDPLSDFAQYRLVRQIGIPKIAPSHVRDPYEVLFVKGLVKPQVRPQLGVVGHRGLVPESRASGVARHESHQREDQEAQHHKCGYAPWTYSMTK